MKKYLVGTSLVLSSFIAPSFAEEANDFYLQIGGGVALPSDTKGDTTLGGTKYDVEFGTDNTALFSVAVGKAFNDFRVEFNYSQATVDSDQFKVTTGGTEASASITPALKSDVKSYMIYGYRDFPNETIITPYVGLGIGLGQFSANDQTATVAGTAYSFKGGDETMLSMGVKGGASYEVAKNTSIYSEAMYQRFAEYKVSAAGYATSNYRETDYFAITAGVKFSF